MDKKLCFIKHIGENIGGQNIYKLLFTSDVDSFFGENFEYKPCGLCNELIPNEGSYDEEYTFITNIKLDLIQDSTCFGFQDCMDGCVALAYENMDDYDEYPEPCRLVLQYGMDIDEVMGKLAQRNIIMEKEVKI